MATPAVAAVPRRGRPPRVSPEAILDAVDAKKASDWTMASIAAELGVSEPAIYYHFPSKQALLLALGARVMSQLPLPDERDDWETWLVEFAEGTLAFCQQHPFLQDVDMASIAVRQSTSVDLLDRIVGYLTRHGFALTDAVMAIGLVMSLVEQFSRASQVSQLDTRELAELASDTGATLAERIYSEAALWDPDDVFPRMVRVVVAGIRLELAPKSSRRRTRP